MNAADKKRWRAKLLAASDACIAPLASAMRREMRLCADEFEAGAFDGTIHADRVTHTLQLHYAATGRTFALIGRDMIAEQNDLRLNPITGRQRADQRMDRDAIAKGLERLSRALEARDIYFGDRVADLVRHQAAHRARQIADTSQGILTEVLERAAAQGLGEAATARLVRQALADDGISIARARMIARTEIGAAQNAGMLAAADEIGANVIKTWVSLHDGRTRATHEAVDGKAISQGQKFQVGDGQLEYPGDPSGPLEEIINCRCTMFLEQAP